MLSARKQRAQIQTQENQIQQNQREGDAMVSYSVEASPLITHMDTTAQQRAVLTQFIGRPSSFPSLLREQEK